jgi:hypothetical protein
MFWFSSATRLALALAPSVIAAQTVVVTFGDIVTTAVVQQPVPLQTIVTVAPPQLITTTIVLTAPASQVTAIVELIPQSVRQIVSEDVGAVVPININGYVTDIKLPASVSVPEEATLSPITPVIIPAATISAQSAASRASAAEDTVGSGEMTY